MNVVGSAEKSAKVQIGKPEAPTNSKGFQSLLASAISKEDPSLGLSQPIAPLNNVATSKITPPMLTDVPQETQARPTTPSSTKTAPNKGVDLSFLGETLEEGKKAPLKLDDLLAGLSHESQAPQGSALINLKTILGSKNDDPALINSALLSLIPPEQQPQAVKALINGAKEFLKQKLNAYIPAERVPHTLKGMVETAVKFDISLDDVKLETIPSSGITKNLLALFEQSQNSTMPTPKHKVNISTQVIDPQVVSASAMAVKAQEAGEVSPLVKLLEQQAKPEIASMQPKNIKDEKEKSKSTTKEELAKLEPAKAALTPDAVIEAVKPITNKKEASPLEQMLASSQSEDTAQETQAHESKEHDQSVGKSELKSKEQLSMEHKNNEGRQLVSKLSADIREAIENYKPPFTKLTLKLNPQQLGEVDVTMVQRGNNVHINLSSNSVALTMLQQQSSELKAALTQAGLGDASMNFSQSNDSQTRQQMQRQHLTSEKYEQMAHLNQEFDKLEIIVPRYV